MNEFARTLGFDRAEKLNRLKNLPDARPTLDVIEALANAFADLNIRWLVTGVGEPFFLENGANTPPYNQLVLDPATPYITDTPTRNTSGKTADSPKAVRPTVQPTTVLSPKIITVDGNGNDNITYVPVKAAAGYLNGYADQEFIEKLPTFSLPGLQDKTYRAFQVDGDSMYPTLENQEMVIGQWVEKLDYIREDRVHVLVTKTRGVIVKRLINRVEKYGYIIAKSDAVDNRNMYPNIEVHPDEIVEIWYAVWHGGFNFKSPTEMYRKVNNLEADLSEVMRVLKANNLLK